jgi:DNA-binding NarL/FixJ family response regulator
MSARRLNGKSKVVIIEDHPMFRERLSHLIDKSNDLRVCAEVDNIRDGFAAIQDINPDVVIVDISLKGSNGLELLKNLKAHDNTVPVLVLSMHDESLYAERALRAGARGYITKHEASVNVMAAIRQVMEGKIYLSSGSLSQIMGKVMKGRDVTVQPIDRLADRELEVFELIGRGLTTREIGARLHLGVTTVDTYKGRIKEKLQLENSARLRMAAARWLQQRE